MNAQAITPFVTILHGQVKTTSLKVAEHFGKQHAHVLRAIRNMECSQEFTESNFGFSEYTDPTGRKLPYEEAKKVAVSPKERHPLQ